VRLIITHWLNPSVRNWFRWDPTVLQDLLHFGSWIFFSTILTFFAGNLDRIVLGKLLSFKELGLYSIALTFAGVGIEISNRLSSTVLFPILSRNQDDPATLVGQSLRARGLILLAGGAMVVAFAIIAPTFFHHLYDPRYAAAGGISQWLSILVWFSIVLGSMDRVPLALGHSRALFICNLVTTASYGVAILGFWLYGLPGFILGRCSGYIIAHLVMLAWIPIRRGAMLTQTLLYTLGIAIYGGIAVYWMHWISNHVALKGEIAAAFLTAISPCAVAGFLILRRLRHNENPTTECSGVDKSG
jgi:O-antigen/teichoic acid export membrane protein